MKTIYTLTVDIPTKAGVLSRRTYYFSRLKDRVAVMDDPKAKGYRYRANIEHVYSVKEALDATTSEENFFSTYSSAA